MNNLAIVPREMPGEREGDFVNRVISVVQTSTTTVTMETHSVTMREEKPGTVTIQEEILHILRQNPGLTNQAIRKTANQRQLVKNLCKGDINRELYRLKDKGLVRFEQVGLNKQWQLTEK